VGILRNVPRLEYDGISGTKRYSARAAASESGKATSSAAVQQSATCCWVAVAQRHVESESSACYATNCRSGAAASQRAFASSALRTEKPSIKIGT